MPAASAPPLPSSSRTRVVLTGSGKEAGEPSRHGKEDGCEAMDQAVILEDAANHTVGAAREPSAAARPGRSGAHGRRPAPIAVKVGDRVKTARLP